MSIKRENMILYKSIPLDHKDYIYADSVSRLNNLEYIS